MKFVLLRASDGAYEKVIELNSLEELTQLANDEGYCILIHPKNDYVSGRMNYPVLQVYDDYLE